MSFEQALAADPASLDALGNYGNALLKLNRPADAIAVYDRALGLAPHNAGLLTNRAIALRKLDRPQEALMSVRRALAAKPDFAQARFVDSLVRLTLGDFNAGWRAYELRWQGRNLSSQRRAFAAPLWLGEGALTGKTILLHAEQGFGDTMQFVRYAPLIAARGARVVLEVQRELVRLVSRLEGIDTVIGRGEALPPFDLHCPLLSLPFACRTELASIPAPVPYLAAADDDMAIWGARLPSRRPRIGVVWSGDPSHDNDVNRSLRPAALGPLFAVPDVDFVSLQYRVRDDDKAALADVPSLFCFEQSFGDFADICGGGRKPRRRGLDRQRGGASRRRAGQAAAPSAAVRRRFPLAARARGQPVVSDRAIVPAAALRRLAKRDRERSAGLARAIRAGGPQAHRLNSREQHCNARIIAARPRCRSRKTLAAKECGLRRELPEAAGSGSALLVGQCADPGEL